MDRSRPAGVHPHVLLPLALALAIGACSAGDRGSPGEQTGEPPLVTVTTVPRRPVQPVSPLPLPSASPVPLTGYDVPGWAEAVSQIEQGRGSNDRLSVPPELQHGSDRRVFLASQLADATDTRVRTPHDLAEIAMMLRSGELVEVAPLSDTHLLYDVGADVRVDPLDHYDPATGEVTPLSPSSEEYAAVASLAADFGGFS